MRYPSPDCSNHHAKQRKGAYCSAGFWHVGGRNACLGCFEVKIYDTEIFRRH